MMTFLPFPLFVLAMAGLCSGIVGFTVSAGLVDNMRLASAVGLAAAAAGVAWLGKRAGFADAVARAPRPACVAFIAGALAAAVQLVWLTVFIVDPGIATWTGRPWQPITSRHSCVSAYWIASTEIERVPSVYDDVLYSVPTPETTRRVPLRLGPFNVDVYEYPPTFLVLPRLVELVAPDFWSFRRLWFALNLGMVVAAAAAIARSIDRQLATHALFLVPFVIAAPPAVGTLQAGNVQLAVIAASMVAMLLVERRRYATGGLLLAYATASKLFPGMLVLYLLLRRDWRAVGWTTAWGVGIVLVTMADFGTAPYATFLDHLPRLLSGEAFPFFRSPESISLNESIPGLVFKLGLFGVPNMGFPVAKVVGWIYTVVVLLTIAGLARRHVATGREPLVWLVILILATMRSPFLATYAGFPSLWLATLVAAVTWGTTMHRLSLVAWGVLAFGLGQGGAPPQLQAIWTFVHTLAAFALVALAFRLTAAAPVTPDDGPVFRQPTPA
jgi:hypothetical protein